MDELFVLYIYIYTRSKRALRAQLLTELCDGTRLLDDMTELYYEIVLKVYITGLYYRIILRDSITNLHYGIISCEYSKESCQDHITELYNGIILWDYTTG